MIWQGFLWGIGFVFGIITGIAGLAILMTIVFSGLQRRQDSWSVYDDNDK